jgi:hypothetical protein
MPNVPVWLGTKAGHVFVLVGPPALLPGIF